MKYTNYIKDILAAVLLLCSSASWAYDFSASNNGKTIYYNILSTTDLTCEVTYYNTDYNSYSGVVVIPETVENRGTTYTVAEIGSHAFGYCTGLREVTIGSSVTTIGLGAFEDCTGLTKVTIGDGVTEIGRYAFSGCTSLTQFEVAEGNEYFCAVDGVLYSKDMATLVLFPRSSPLLPSFDIPNSVTEIGSYAFSGCTGLTEVTIGESVTEISSYAFSNCTGLTEVTIPESVTKIGSCAFYQCTGLTEVNFNAIACTSAGSSSYQVFRGCTNIATVNFGDDVTRIPSLLCYGLTELTEITIPNRVTEIGSFAFEYCTRLADITIGNSVTSIGQCAFEYCTSLAEVTIPNSVTEIGISAFYQCPGLTELTIPESVTTIGNYAFYGCTGMTELTIGESVTKIGSCAFCDCTGLTEVNFNATACTSAGSSSYLVFRGCTNIATVTIGEDVATIPDYLFYNCTSLTEVNFNATACTSAGSSSNPVFSSCKNISTVTIGEGVTVLPTYLFYNCTGIVEVNFNATACTSAGSSYSDRAFYGCTNISTAKFGENVAIIPAYMCYQCTRLTEVTIPNRVTEIGSFAFEYCTSLAEVTIPNSVTSIGQGAFEYCTSLAEVTIPNSVTEIGISAFYGCTGLTEITIGESVTEIGRSAFEGCSGITEVNFNATACTSVSYSTFSGCDNISTVNIGENVTIIPAYLCYELTGLTSVTIPNSVTEIGSGAFRNCTKLSEVNFNATACTSAGSYYDFAFRGCTNIATINIGENVTIIPAYLYYHCTGLTEVTIPESVTEIGSCAFCDCTGLTEVTIGESVIEISSSAFNGCTGLAGVTIPNSVTTIGSGAFYGCTGLTEVNFNATACTSAYAGSVYSSSPFSDCSQLSTVNIGENVTTLPDYLFYDCTGITEVNFNATACTSAGSSYSSGAFGSCPNIATVNIGENVTTLPDYLFYDCTGITEVNFNATACTSAGFYDSAFRGCTNIATVNIGENVTIIPAYLCYGLTGLTSVTIPESVTEISRSAFSGCTGLTEITVPSGVTEIGSYAFSNCKLDCLYMFCRLNSYLGVFNGLKCGTVYAHADQLETIGEYWSGTLLPIEAGYALSITDIYPRSLVVDVTSDERLHMEDAYVLRVEVDGREITMGADGLYVATDLMPATSYSCELYYVSGGDEFTYETTVETDEFWKSVVKLSSTDSSVSFRITLKDDAYSGMPDEYGVVDGTTYYAADSDGVVVASDLQPGGTYTFEAYVKYGGEEARGCNLSVYIECIPPTVLTYPATEVTSSSATITISVTAGSEEILEKGIEYWVTEDDVHTIKLDEEMSVRFKGLKEATTYVYRGYAKTNSGTVYGETTIFTTLSAEALGIDGIISDYGDDVWIYDLSGRRVLAPERGNVYIFRYMDGTVKKALVK